MKKGSLVKSIIVFLVICIGIVFYLEKSSRDSEGIILEKSTSENEGSTLKKEDDSSGVLYIHITGEVKSPGVYELEEGSRIYQVVELAGGLKKTADEESINLADKVYDGMKIVVAKKAASDTEGVEKSTLDYEADGRININTATEKELMSLPGIGEAKAKSIVEYREFIGRFENVEDIMNISGIKEGAYNKIKDLIKV